MLAEIALTAEGVVSGLVGNNFAGSAVHLSAAAATAGEAAADIGIETDVAAVEIVMALTDSSLDRP